MRQISKRRPAFTLVELLVVVAIIAILVALLVPAVQKVRYAAARTQTTNNMKQCALAAHAYHDAWKYLPFNGTAGAVSTDNSSGSWAYQALPYLEQQAMYDAQPANAAMGEPVAPLLCAVRARPGYYEGAGSAAVTGQIMQHMPNTPVGPADTLMGSFTANPSFTYAWPVGPGNWDYFLVNVSGPVSIQIQYTNVNPILNTYNNPIPAITQAADVGSFQTGTFTITSLAAGASGFSPATDFGINVFLNDANGGINSPNVRRQLDTISDGTSNTILLGHAYVQPIVYSSTTAVPPSLQSIFVGGSLATSRNTLGDNATDWLQDGAAVTSNQWGSPLYEGGLMALCDGTVRIFPYATPLTNFLLPDDGNPVELP